ncbi:ribosome biogenesis protein YTM1 [Neolentinus lepideus HHB14362 ss-1]|uniref:Ribosome biogenesis protein YTM1 n=1 Tax=Neolentinus lepideus HHB14362 ss-1 TaxID=1314782 RepID=A0A165MVT8_9AGAM|nr:ribosome biogenesis protein YTM1 [Neolentinus lepideus HHB14362 ss-1]
MSSTTESTRPAVFTTSTAYPLPTQKFMIPASWRRYQLSQLINKALSLDKTIPFDFLIQGEILRGTLAEWCAEKSVGEETLEIEYIESVLPPQQMRSMPHEDWVSSVSCRISRTFVTGSYDGSLCTFSYSQQLLQTLRIHDAPITSLCVLPPSDNDQTYTVATASQDLTARLTKIQLSADTLDAPSSSQMLASLHLHTSPLSSISTDSSGSHLLTSGWDTLIGLWDTSIPTEDEISPDDLIPGRVSKRRKVNKEKSQNGVESRVRRKAPTQVLKSHTARVSKAVFGTDESAAGRSAAYSCGFDSTVRVWDVESGVCLHTINASEKPMTDLVLMSESQTALASATDRTVTAYDIRLSSSSASPAVASMPHPALPSCLAVSGMDSNSHQFISGAYDGVVRLWDLRSVKAPIASFKVTEGKKVLSVDWLGASGLVGVGGEGGLEVWRIGAESAPVQS